MSLAKMQATLADAGYTFVDGFHVVEPGDWGDERGVAIGQDKSGRWALVEWVDSTTCPSCSGGYDVEGPVTCLDEVDARGRLRRAAACR